MFSDTFAGIAPASAPGFIAAQAVGGLLAYVGIRTLYPDVSPADAADVIVPHDFDGRVSPNNPSSERDEARQASCRVG
jgi:hypothetical protein